MELVLSFIEVLIAIDVLFVIASARAAISKDYFIFFINNRRVRRSKILRGFLVPYSKPLSF